jgi:hypothetical protein
MWHQRFFSVWLRRRWPERRQSALSTQQRFVAGEAIAGERGVDRIVALWVLEAVALERGATLLALVSHIQHESELTHPFIARGARQEYASIQHRARHT